ncbi:MAG TPA: FAD:protein FMN transferase [Candidatus Saccharimonadales bacterium]|nr:FAD:protein FMN transferase [Candidatus Saccharimonadales bacterium]
MAGHTPQISFDAIGTRWEIEITEPVSEKQLSTVKESILERTEKYDKTYSRFRDDSLVTRIAEAAGTYTFPADADRLFELYRQLYDATDGVVTPLIGNLISAAGYDAQYSLRPASHLSSPMPWDDVMAYEHPRLITRAPVLLDFGAAGKGYLVDIIGELLRGHGISSYLIDAGGDMLHSGSQPIRIGFENPNDPTEVLGVANVQNQSICGSAGNRRSWAGIHHIMNPLTTEPVRDVLAAWAVAPTALVADGIATALFFTPAAKLKALFDFEYLLVRSDMSCEYSPGLQAEIFWESPA